MNEILDMLQDVDMLLIAIVIGIVVAGILEAVKYFTKNQLTEDQIKLSTLFLGLIGGVVAMYLNSGDFTTYGIVGIAGGIYAPSIYEFIIKRFGFTDKLKD